MSEGIKNEMIESSPKLYINEMISEISFFTSSLVSLREKAMIVLILQVTMLFVAMIYRLFLFEIGAHGFVVIYVQWATLLMAFLLFVESIRVGQRFEMRRAAGEAIFEEVLQVVEHLGRYDSNRKAADHNHSIEDTEIFEKKFPSKYDDILQYGSEEILRRQLRGKLRAFRISARLPGSFSNSDFGGYFYVSILLLLSTGAAVFLQTYLVQYR